MKLKKGSVKLPVAKVKIEINFRRLLNLLSPYFLGLIW